jgi:hypothetical protein
MTPPLAYLAIQEMTPAPAAVVPEWVALSSTALEA